MEDEEALAVTSGGEPDTEVVKLSVRVAVVVPVLVELDGATGEPSVREVESVPVLGRLLKLALSDAEEVVLTGAVPKLVEADEEEVELAGLMGDPEVTDPDGMGGPQLPVP